LLLGLITPKRLKENEEFMVRLADRLLDDLLPGGRCEFMGDYCQPYTMLVTAHLLGVPESDHPMLLEQISLNGSGLPGSTVPEQSAPYQSQDRFYEYFSEAVEDRRKEPRGDVLTGLALATFPDGTVPDPIEVARVGSILFSAGQGGNTAGMLGAALQRNGDDPELQQLLRDRHDLIPNFVEETLRMEGAVKGDFRLARKSSTLAGVEIPAGTTVMVLNSAASRDPRHFECPGEFRVERGNARHHLAFGHGIHTCPGAPLARLEGRVTVERLLDRTTNIEISEEEHGSSGDRRYQYLPTYMFRILSGLHLTFT
jgi:cytochrome P450